MKLSFSGNLKGSLEEVCKPKTIVDIDALKDFVVEQVKDLKLHETKVVDIGCGTYVVERVE